MKKLLEVLTSGAAYLEQRGVEEARLNMEHLLAHVLGCRRLDLYLRFQETLHEPDLLPLRNLLRRRGEGVPLQHLLGTVDFLGHELVCDHRALIPRPETEHLVDTLIRQVSAGKSPQPMTVLDMGTGSGCIGLALAAAWPTAQVTLADIAEDALDLAQLNASRLGLQNLHFRRSDLFEKLPGRWHLIVANLPYIPAAEVPTLSREVRRDPITALDGGADGLEIVRRFLEQAPAHLEPAGRVVLEVGHDQGAATAQMAREHGFQNPEIFPDLAGIPRFVSAVLG
ncbi:MAG: peptide chain release factor N(5)-glutamine methyltransferase [Prosthecobacter sp.]|nr:peptide chain release factor N(5)-glutamine methyltransferase [Prosthecobacter sp.]